MNYLNNVTKDASGRITSWFQGTLQYRVLRDSQGKPLQVTQFPKDPYNGVMSFTYNPDGTLDSVKDLGLIDPAITNVLKEEALNKGGVTVQAVTSPGGGVELFPEEVRAALGGISRVPTIAALKALPVVNLVDGAAITVVRYYEGSVDKIYETYVWDENNTTPENGGTVIGGAATGRFVRPLREFERAIAWGVRSEDGATFSYAAENVAATNRALAAINAAGGGALLMPAGRVTVDGPFLIGANTKLYGTKKTRLSKDPSSTTDYVVIGNGAHHSEVSGFKVEMDAMAPLNVRTEIRFVNSNDVKIDRISASGLRYCVVRLEGVDGFEVTNISAKDSPNAVINLMSLPCANGIIRNVRLHNCWEAVDFGGIAHGPHYNVHVSNVYGTSDVPTTEELIDIGSSQRLTFKNIRANNYLNGVVLKTEPVGAQFFPSRDIIFEDFFLENIANRGFSLNHYDSTVGNSGNFTLRNIRQTGGVECVYVQTSPASQATHFVESIVIENLTNSGVQKFLCTTGRIGAVVIRNVRLEGETTPFEFGENGGYCVTRLDVDGLVTTTPLEIFAVKNICRLRNLDIAGSATVDHGIRFNRCTGVDLSHFTVRGSRNFGVTVVHANTATNNAGISIKNGFIENPSVGLTADNRRGFVLITCVGGVAGQSLVGVQVTGLRCRSDAGGGARRAVAVEKGSWDNVNGLVVDGNIFEGQIEQTVTNAIWGITGGDAAFGPAVLRDRNLIIP